MNKINAEEFLKQKSDDIFSTGFDGIDDCTKNIDKGSIITIGGRPSMGKTSFALSILNHLIDRNKKVFWFSPSMMMQKITLRIVANKLGLAHYDLDRIPNEKPIITKEALKYFEEKELFISDKTNLTVEDIENEIKENRPDVVFIDYIQLLKMPKAPNFTDSINLAVQEIKRIAQETGVIFVLLTQLSRSLENRCSKRPVLSDIRNSSLLEELSDIVMMIYRHEYYVPDDELYRNAAEIIFCKNNFGPLAIINLKYDKGIFSEQPGFVTF